MSKQVQAGRFVRKATAVAVMTACASGAFAYEWETEGGWTGTISTQVGVSASWRASNRDGSLLFHNDAVAAGLPGATLASLGATSAAGGATGSVSQPTALYTGAAAAAIASGYLAGNRGDAHNLNYDKGDRYSTLFKFVTDLELKKGSSGALFRVKGWYDQAQKDEVVPYGGQSNRFAGAGGSAATAANPLGKGLPTTLSDESNDPLARFDGLELLDAYVYTSLDLGNSSMQVRLGKQALNWGESVFIQGVNQISPLDATALRKAGAELKEGLLPIWAISASVGLGGGVDLGGFYQLKWTNTVVDSCGTFWGSSESTIGLAGRQNCDMVTAFAGSAPAQFDDKLLAGLGAFVPAGLNPAYTSVAGINSLGLTPGITTNPYPRFLNTIKPKNSGQGGVTLRFPVESIDTEIGLYAMNIHNRIPSAVGKLASAAYLDAVNTQATALLNNAASAAGVAAAVGAGLTPGSAAFNGTVAAVTAAEKTNGAAAFGAASSFRQLAGGSGFTAQLIYPEKLKIYGVSAAFNVAGWSVGSELSYQKDVPVPLNANDYIQAALFYQINVASIAAGATPLGVMSSAAAAAVVKATYNGGGAGRNNLNLGPLGGRMVAAGLGGTVNGYDLFHKTQFQFNGVKALPTDWADLFGAVSGTFVGEVGMQWNNVPAASGDVPRYGRSPLYGAAPSALYGIAPTAGVAAGGGLGLPASLFPGVAAAPAYANTVCNSNNPQPDGRCTQEGFVNDFAWGYRVRVAMDYPGVFGGWVMTPSVFFAHDVDGTSMDGQFNDRRKVVGLGLKFNLNKAHDINFGYQAFLKSPWDIARDHDNYSASYSYTF